MVINRTRRPPPDDPQQPSQPAHADILIVEDDPETAESLGRRALEYFDRPAVLASSLFEAEAVLDEHTPRIVLVDMLLPDGDGTELMFRLARDGVPAVAVVTAAPSLYRATVALRTQAADFLVKPFTDEQLTAMFERLNGRLAQHDELCRLRRQADSNAEANRQLRMKIDILCKDLVAGYQKLVTQLIPHDE